MFALDRGCWFINQGRGFCCSKGGDAASTKVRKKRAVELELYPRPARKSLKRVCTRQGRKAAQECQAVGFDSLYVEYAGVRTMSVLHSSIAYAPSMPAL